MTWIIAGCLILGLLLGGAGMKRHLRAAGAMWRPGAGMLALAAFVLAIFMVLREKWPVAIPFFLAGSWLALSARRRAGPRPSGGVSKLAMSPADAASILGVSETATKEEIQAAYLHLMRRAHPDSGGTTGLATQLNTAREVLLKKR